jgi:hypothetical protein
MLRSDDFKIEFVGSLAENREGPVARIKVGSFEERFRVDLSYWSVQNYEQSWHNALLHLEDGSDVVSCLISSMINPAYANFVHCWPMYRNGNIVHVQNSIIFMEEVADRFEPSSPWKVISPRETVSAIHDGCQPRR